MLKIIKERLFCAGLHPPMSLELARKGKEFSTLRVLETEASVILVHITCALSGMAQST